MRVYALILLLLLTGLFNAKEAVSARVVDVDAINLVIDEAAAAGAVWPGNPMLALKEIFGGNQRNYTTASGEPDPCGKGTGGIKVLIMRGSFSRDWGWGDWCEVHFRKIADGTWRLCYVLPMNKTGASVRRPSVPLKARPAAPATVPKSR